LPALASQLLHAFSNRCKVVSSTRARHVSSACFMPILAGVGGEYNVRQQRMKHRF